MGGFPVEQTYVGIKTLNPNAKVPVYSSEEAAGADLHACLDDAMTVTIHPGARALVPTGIAIELNPGLEAQIRSRSGLAAKNGIMVLNSPGTIDSDYRGEIKVILYNTGTEPFVVKNGDRIAQMVIAPVLRGVFQATGGVLSATARGEGGFGSTGV